MLGIARLDEHRAGAIASPGPARDLHEDLERALGRAKVGHRERRVGVDDTDQRDARQIVSLGHHLRSDQDVHLARAHALEHRLGLGTRRDVAVEPRDACLGKRLSDGVFELLGAEPLEEQRLAPALGTGVGHRRREIAIVATEPALALAMERQRDRAELAPRDRAARRADDTRREAAPVQKEDRLLLRFERLFDRAVQRKRQERVTARSRSDPPQIDELDLRQHGRLVRPRWELEPRELPLSAKHLRFERRRRRTEHGDGARAMRPEDSHVARVVARSLLLLERAVVFLVDDDETELLHGREKRRARANGDRHASRAKPAPHEMALLFREPAVNHGDVIAEARAESADELGRQRDLGHENERAFARREARGDGPQVDFRFTRARHAIEKERLRVAPRDRRRERLGGGVLRARQHRWDVAVDGLGEKRARRHFALAELDQAERGQTLHRRARSLPPLLELRNRSFGTGSQVVEDLDRAAAKLTGARRAVRGRCNEPHGRDFAPPHRTRPKLRWRIPRFLERPHLRAFERRKRHSQHFADGRQVIRRELAQETEELGKKDGLVVDDRTDRFQLRLVERRLAVGHFEHDAERLFRTELAEHAHARRHPSLHRRGHLVRKGAAERHGDRYVGEHHRDVFNASPSNTRWRRR